MRHDTQDDDGPAGSTDDARDARRPRAMVLHNDPDLLVIDRSPGLEIEIDSLGQVFLGEVPRALSVALRLDENADDEDLWALDPLSQEVSGLLILLRSAAAREALAKQLTDGVCELQYHALVRGPVVGESGTIDRPVRPRHSEGARDPAAPKDKTKTPARTDWHLLDAFVGYALLECRPRTLVQDQIRIHLQSEGMPLVVDLLYSGAKKLLLSSFKSDYRPSRKHEERPLIERVTLHAAAAKFRHPVDGSRLAFEALPAKDFKAALHQLDRFARIPPA